MSSSIGITQDVTRESDYYCEEVGRKVYKCNNSNQCWSCALTQVQMKKSAMTIYNVHGADGLKHFRFLKSVASYYCIPYQPLAKAMRDAKSEIVNHKGLNIWKAEVITK